MPAADPGVKDFLSQAAGKPVHDLFAGMTIVDYPDGGLTVYFDEDQRLVTIFLYGEATADHAHFEGELPSGLSFRDSNTDVTETLGAPSKSGRECSTGLPWERFDFPTYSLHLQFRADLTAIKMITLMPPSMLNKD